VGIGRYSNLPYVLLFIYFGVIMTVALGSAVTNQIVTGNGELRIGPLDKAGVLTQAYSIGAVQNMSFELATTSINAKAGSPQKTYATAITGQEWSLKGSTLDRSFSNLNAVIGNGLIASPVDVNTYLVSDEVAGSVSITVALATGITVNSQLIIYPEGQPERVSVVTVSAVVGTTVTLKASTPLLYDMAGATDLSRQYNIFVGNPIAGGNVTGKVNYFTATWIKQSGTGRPIIYVFWKVAAKGNFTDAGNATAYAEVPIEFEILAPSAKDIAIGGPLYAMADLIALNPAYMMYQGADI
jgi:hypothetical protein